MAKSEGREQERSKRLLKASGRAVPDSDLTANASEPSVSVVIPVLNEEKNLSELYRRLVAALETVTRDFEIILVDDGSTDETRVRALEMHRQDRRVKLISLARNFGHQLAQTAGMDAASGRAIVQMDADLQHPPEVIPELIERWREGYDVVYTVRESTKKVPWLKRRLTLLAYAILRYMCEVDMIVDAADFRLVDRRAARAYRDCRELYRFNRGLFRWIGFRQTSVRYHQDERFAGEAKYTFRQLLRLLLDGLFSFSSAPLRMFGKLGVAFAVLGGIYLTYGVAAFIFMPQNSPPGWTSIAAAVIIMGGLQMVGLWLIGEYLGRTYDESKNRPLYVVSETHGEFGERVRWHYPRQVEPTFDETSVRK